MKKYFRIAGLLVSLTAFAPNLVADELPDGEIVDWTPGSAFASLQIARTLQVMAVETDLVAMDYAAERQITSADCTAHAFRPTYGGPVFYDEAILNCVVTLDDGTNGSISWDFSKLGLSAGGNRFAPSGFSIKGADAQFFFETFHSMTNADETIEWVFSEDTGITGAGKMKETPDGILRKELVEMIHPQGWISLDMNFFTSVDEAGERNHVMVCSKYANIVKYERDEDGVIHVDVEETAKFRCDFYFRFKVNG